MSRVRCNRWYAFLAAAAIEFAGVAQAQTGRARAIEFSEPRSEIATTNVDGTAARKPLRNLNQAVKKPFDVFNGADSFSGALAPPPQLPAQPNLKSKKVREMIERKLERQRDWAFMTPEDMYGPETPEEMMNVAEFDEDGMPKSRKSKLEIYYERMQKRDAGNTNHVNRVAQGDANRNDEQREKSEKTLEEEKRSIFAARETESKRPSIVKDVDRTTPTLPPTAEKRFSDFFGFSSPEADHPFENSAAREARMQEFKEKVIEARSPASSFSAPSAFASPAPVAAPAFSAGTFGNSAITPAPTPPSFSAFSAAPSQPSLAPAFTPPPQPTYRPPTPAPVFELPRRKY